MNSYFTSEISDCLDLLGTPWLYKREAKYATARV